MKKREMRQCESCHQISVVPVRRPNHLLHVVLTVLTCGLWLIVWALAGVESAASRAPLCPRCEGRML